MSPAPTLAPTATTPVTVCVTRVAAEGPAAAGAVEAAAAGLDAAEAAVRFPALAGTDSDTH
ncbi:MAG TPA: hypothetical protein VF855_03115, partial [Acidimicrobiales bacterium]